jgi:hypothetical protein
MAVLVHDPDKAAPFERMSVMKRLLIATLLAASTLGLANIAMANTAVPSSDGSFIKQQSLQYNQDNGQ